MAAAREQLTRAPFTIVLATLILLLITTKVVSEEGTTGLKLIDKYRSELAQELVEFDESFSTDYNYLDALEEYERNGYISPSSNVAVTIGPENLIIPDGDSTPIRRGIGGNNEPVLVWESNVDFYEWDFSVPEDGLYEIIIEYFGFGEESSPIQRQLSIDGEVPFEEAYSVALYRAWRDEGPAKVNNLGDEVRPRQIQETIWQVQTGRRSS